MDEEHSDAWYSSKRLSM